ncbi:MAG TPA: hypothetical protein VNJ47_12785, partial [Nevskiales bacterium]|nr:hypothetical protein [Nevskiales bacterium]
MTATAFSSARNMPQLHISRFAIPTSFLLLIGAWCYWAGLDMNADLINYHLYGAYQLLNHRLTLDYFAAGTQGYFNPLAFVPLYLMTKAEWHSAAITAVLALFHSLNLWLIWCIGDNVLARNLQHRRRLLWLGTALAFVAPIFLTTLGNTFADPITSVLVLAGLYKLLPSQNAGKWTALQGGMLLGIAAGLKLTNAFLVVTACLTLLVLDFSPLKLRVRRLVLCGTGALVGGLVSHGYWSYVLWREFRNPVFPLFNHIFQSPDFLTAMNEDRGLLNQGIWDIFTLPLRMLEHKPWVYAENTVPDLRPLMLLVIIVVGMAHFLRTRDHRSLSGTPDSRNYFWLLGFFLVSFVLWAVLAGIGRYALPLWLLLGPLIIGALQRISRDTRVTAAFAVLILVAQITIQAHSGNPRWNGIAWQATWVDPDVPTELKHRPYLYLSMVPGSYSFIFPWLHPESRFVHIVGGQYTIPAGQNMPHKL